MAAAAVIGPGDLYGYPTMFTPQNRFSSTTGVTLGFYMLKVTGLLVFVLFLS